MRLVCDPWTCFSSSQEAGWYRGHHWRGRLLARWVRHMMLASIVAVSSMQHQATSSSIWVIFLISVFDFCSHHFHVVASYALGFVFFILFCFVLSFCGEVIFAQVRNHLHNRWLLLSFFNCCFVFFSVASEFQIVILFCSIAILSGENAFQKENQEWLEAQLEC